MKIMPCNAVNSVLIMSADAHSWRSFGREPKGRDVSTIHNGKIRYLFDITQTSASENTSMPWIWEINDSQLNIDYKAIQSAEIYPLMKKRTICPTLPIKLL